MTKHTQLLTAATLSCALFLCSTETVFGTDKQVENMQIVKDLGLKEGKNVSLKLSTCYYGMALGPSSSLNIKSFPCPDEVRRSKEFHTKGFFVLEPSGPKVSKQNIRTTLEEFGEKIELVINFDYFPYHFLVYSNNNPVKKVKRLVLECLSQSSDEHDLNGRDLAELVIGRPESLEELTLCMGRYFSKDANEYRNGYLLTIPYLQKIATKLCPKLRSLTLVCIDLNGADLSSFKSLKNLTLISCGGKITKLPPNLTDLNVSKNIYISSSKRLKLPEWEKKS